MDDEIHLVYKDQILVLFFVSISDDNCTEFVTANVIVSWYSIIVEPSSEVEVGGSILA